ncbi:MAG TPA: FKBP-type peptidyl-prolyl cis-trans isomerase, partial [Planctomycetaceae bacterium]|nr:FKBP-type peptidyl-prolyl cis-trans isomerase [Planctomycetaceae bacterium]
LLLCAAAFLPVGMNVMAQAPVQPGAEDKDAPKEFTATKSGLKYRILRKAEGKKPKATDTVKVHYKGWLDDKKEFDSSYKRGEPIEFPLNGVIPGWTEGMQLVGEGGMVELEIPANLGYGARGIPGVIPPNSTLHFLVELIAVK